MLQFVKQKIKNKRWLNVCLLAGIVLLTAMFSCHPMFERGASNQLLQTAFTDYAEENRQYPAVFCRSGIYECSSYPDANSVIAKLEAYESKWLSYVEVDSIQSQKSLKLSGSNGVSNLASKKRFLSPMYMEHMEEHIQMVRGTTVEEADMSAYPKDAIPCIVSEPVMDAYGLVVGEQMTFTYTVEGQEATYPMVVVGIFKEAQDGSNFWYHNPAYFEKIAFVSEADFDRILAMTQTETSTITYEDNLLLDYTQISCDNASVYLNYIQQFKKNDAYFSDNVTQILEEYLVQEKTARTILWVLELPCIVLLLLFIYMVSSQILSAEEGEIAVLRSRGVTKKQTICLYILQSSIIACAGCVLGIALGYGMCKLAASTDAFLSFAAKDIHLYQFTVWMLPYALAAGVIAVLFMTIPVWRRAGITIVQQKTAGRYNTKPPFWEKFFLDLALLGVSIYLLYNYNKQSGTLSFSVMDGGSLDPMIFLDASLFIFSCGLVFLRLIRYLVIFVDFLGKKRWKPAMYASFLQIRRTFRQQGFLAVFLIMTIANGIFDANMARTMNQNNEERIAYNMGTDAILTENWKLRMTKGTEGDLYWSYEAPNDFEGYRQLVSDGVCESVTRVIEDDNTRMSGNGKNIAGCMLMGIHTREFGQTAELKDGLNDRHWYEALNALSQTTDGVIISRNLAKEAELEIGDTIRYTRYSPIVSQKEKEINTVNATVCAIVDAFPGYLQYTYENNPQTGTVEEQNYLLVANYATVVSEFGLTPYRVWMRLNDGGSSAKVLDALKDRGIAPDKWQALDDSIGKSRSSAMIQITNGMFTLSFLISLIICSVGFLIYWIMSIKNRELLFGIYRAMGMQMKEIRWMLVNEQIFSSLLSIVAGGGVGALATFLFVRLIVLVYLPQKHNIPIEIYIYASDIIKLFAAILVVVIVCLMVLRRLLLHMNIAQALKMGED